MPKQINKSSQLFESKPNYNRSSNICGVGARKEISYIGLCLSSARIALFNAMSYLSHKNTQSQSLRIQNDKIRSRFQRNLSNVILQFHSPTINITAKQFFLKKKQVTTSVKCYELRRNDEEIAFTLNETHGSKKANEIEENEEVAYFWRNSWSTTAEMSRRGLPIPIRIPSDAIYQIQILILILSEFGFVEWRRRRRRRRGCVLQRESWWWDTQIYPRYWQVPPFYTCLLTDFLFLFLFFVFRLWVVV